MCNHWLWLKPLCFHGSLLQVFFPESGQTDSLKEMSLEAKGGGWVQRHSAKIAVYHLQELASAELTKEWPKRKLLQDLVPDDRKVRSRVAATRYFIDVSLYGFVWHSLELRLKAIWFPWKHHPGNVGPSWCIESEGTWYWCDQQKVSVVPTDQLASVCLLGNSVIKLHWSLN